MNELRLTVYFEDPFWVGVFERTRDGEYSACKLTFGAEPRDCEVYDNILRHFSDLRFSPAMKAEEKTFAANPKRRQREAKKQLKDTGAGTKSQQALAMQCEQLKTERKQQSRARREAEKQRRFAQKQQKKLQKHRGH